MISRRAVIYYMVRAIILLPATLFIHLHDKIRQRK